MRRRRSARRRRPSAARRPPRRCCERTGGRIRCTSFNSARLSCTCCGQLERRGRVEAQRLGRNAVQLAAVGVERRRAHRRQHQRGRLDRRWLRARASRRRRPGRSSRRAAATPSSTGFGSIGWYVGCGSLVPPEARNSSRMEASQASADSTRIGLATSCRIVATRRYRSSWSPAHRRTLPQPSTFRRRGRRGSAGSFSTASSMCCTQASCNWSR